MRRIIAIPFLLAVIFLVPGRPAAGTSEANPGGEEHPSAAIAGRLWLVTDVVLEHHLDPPTRQEMLLAATRSLFHTAKAAPSADLSRQLSGVTTREQFADLLKQIWPGGKKEIPSADAGMLHGLLISVPGRPNIIPAKDVPIMESVNLNRYVGIGVQVALDPQEQLVQIKVPLRGGTAKKAGMKIGDLIVSVDGTDVKGMNLTKVVDLLRGKEGTTVTVVVRQPGDKETRTLKMVRAVVPFENVLGHRRGLDDQWIFRPEPGVPVGYLAIRRIGAGVLNELRQMEPKLQADGCKALVIDLRFNPGGTLTHAAMIADAFLDGGLLWKVRPRRGDVKEFRADRDCLFRDWPVVVLIDGTTNSAAELVAAALKDNNRVVLVGEPSSGNSNIKSLLDLPQGGGKIVLQTGRTERVVKMDNPWPLQPDHIAQASDKQRQEILSWQQLQDLPEPPGVDVDAPKDPVLTRAMDLLRELIRK